MLRMRNILLLPLLLLSLATQAAEDPRLTVRVGGKEAIFTRSELLARPDVETVVVKDDPSYPGREMTYRAVPVRKLLARVDAKGDEMVQFKCLDGFAAPLNMSQLLNASPKKSIALVAIEPSDAPWPPLKKEGGPTAGPFYLIWRSPQLSKIGKEQWPFQLASLESRGKLESVYPHVVPNSKLKPTHPVRLGFEVFRKNCFACHTMNHEGDSQMGPDLNLPMNPTDYFQESALRKLVRNPHDVREWPKLQMPGFNKSAISDQELDQLIAYLRYMGARKSQNGKG